MAFLPNLLLPDTALNPDPGGDQSLHKTKATTIRPREPHQSVFPKINSSIKQHTTGYKFILCFVPRHRSRKPNACLKVSIYRGKGKKKLKT